MAADAIDASKTLLRDNEMLPSYSEIDDLHYLNYEGNVRGNRSRFRFVRRPQWPFLDVYRETYFTILTMHPTLPDNVYVLQVLA